MQIMDYPGVGMTSVHYLHDLIWGIWRLTSLSGLSPDPEDTHIYIYSCGILRVIQKKLSWRPVRVYCWHPAANVQCKEMYGLAERNILLLNE